MRVDNFKGTIVVKISAKVQNLKFQRGSNTFVPTCYAYVSLRLLDQLSKQTEVINNKIFVDINDARTIKKS